MIKDRAIATGWIAGLLLIISLLFFLTRPVQTRQLMQTVNNVFIASGNPHRLVSHLDRPRGRSALFGFWYSMLDTSDTMFVFAFFRDGLLVLCGARVSASGTVEEIIPISVHAKQVFENIPQAVIQMYTRRIETAKRHVAAAGGGR